MDGENTDYSVQIIFISRIRKSPINEAIEIDLTACPSMSASTGKQFHSY